MQTAVAIRNLKAVEGGLTKLGVTPGGGGARGSF